MIRHAFMLPRDAYATSAMLTSCRHADMFLSCCRHATYAIYYIDATAAADAIMLQRLPSYAFFVTITPLLFLFTLFAATAADACHTRLMPRHYFATPCYHTICSHYAC